MEHVGNHRSGHSSKGRIDKLIYFTACDSALHRSLLYILYAKYLPKAGFPVFTWWGIQSHSPSPRWTPFFFAFPRRIFHTISAWLYTNYLSR